jgi:hypothetical protein
MEVQTTNETARGTNSDTTTSRLRPPQFLELEGRRPVLSSVYDTSCWSYSVVGMVLLKYRTRLPFGGRALPVVSGALFGSMLCVQGFFSYANDVLVMRNRSELLSSQQPAVVWGDRILATTNSVCALGCARSWPAGPPVQRLLRNALVGSLLFFPASKAFEEAGRIEEYMYCHSGWHYAPTGLGILYIALHARARPTGVPRALGRVLGDKQRWG